MFLKYTPKLTGSKLVVFLKMKFVKNNQSVKIVYKTGISDDY